MKLAQFEKVQCYSSRPRKGAWIEICWERPFSNRKACRPRKGAWIEIRIRTRKMVRLWSRPRKGAWIEMMESTSSPRWR